MKGSQNEERLPNLVMISMNKVLQKKMKVERGANTSCYKMIDNFGKKKRRIKLIYK